MALDRNGLEILSRGECLELLGHAHIGRVALSVGALPVILPVNFAMMAGDVVVRSGPGTKMDAALDHTVVAFEVDAFSALDHTGRSVLVQGLASEIVHPAELSRASQLPLRPWTGDGMSRYIRIRTQQISGRRLIHQVAPVAVTPTQL